MSAGILQLRVVHTKEKWRVNPNTVRPFPRLFPFECCAFLCLLLSPCFLSNKASALYSSFLITKTEESFVSLVVG